MLNSIIFYSQVCDRQYTCMSGYFVYIMDNLTTICTLFKVLINNWRFNFTVQRVQHEIIVFLLFDLVLIQANTLLMGFDTCKYCLT